MTWFILPFVFLNEGHAQSVRTIRLCENAVATINVSTKGSVLDFPSEPQKVVLGMRGSFNVEYIKNDLAISPSNLGARSNLFVYLSGRRFSLELGTQAAAPTLYFIKDCENAKRDSKK